MGELTNKDLQDAFMEGFCYAEDVGHTTGKKLAEQAAKRYPVEAKAEAGELNLQNIINILDEESADISKSISSEDIANRILQLARPALADALREALERARYVLALFAETSVGTFGVNGVVTSKRDYAQKAVEDADAALRQSDPHAIPPEDDNCEPPEPDLMGHDYREDIRR